MKNPVIVASTDGVGTKLEIANQIKKYNTIGIDLVAMCVNDLIVQGAKPIFFLDYIAIHKLDLEKVKKTVTRKRSKRNTMKIFTSSDPKKFQKYLLQIGIKKNVSVLC